MSSSADEHGVFDVLITGISKIPRPSIEELGIIIFPEDNLDEDSKDEAIIAQGVNYTQVRHIKKVLKNNDVKYAVRIHETNKSEQIKTNFIPKNIALLEALGNNKNYKLSGADGLYIAVLIFTFLLFAVNVIYAEMRADTELHRAVKRQDITKVENILSKSSYKISLKDSEGRTPLHYINGKNAYIITEILIEKGSDVNSRDKYGKTPLDYLKESKESDAMLIKMLSVKSK